MIFPTLNVHLVSLGLVCLFLKNVGGQWCPMGCVCKGSLSDKTKPFTPGLLRTVPPQWFQELFHQMVNLTSDEMIDFLRQDQGENTPIILNCTERVRYKRRKRAANMGTESSTSLSVTEDLGGLTEALTTVEPPPLTSLNLPIIQWMETLLEDYLFNNKDHFQLQTSRSRKACQLFGPVFLKTMHNRYVFPLSKYGHVVFTARNNAKGKIFYSHGGIWMDVYSDSMECVGEIIQDGWVLHYMFMVPEVKVRYRYEFITRLGRKIGVMNIALGEQKMHAKIAVTKGANQTCKYEDLGLYLELDHRKYAATFNESDYPRDFEKYQEDETIREYNWKEVLNTLMVEYVLFSNDMSMVYQEKLVPNAGAAFLSEMGYNLCDL